MFKKRKSSGKVVSSELRRRKNISAETDYFRIFINIVIFSLTVFIFSAGFYGVFLSGFFQVKKIEIRGCDRIIQEDIKAFFGENFQNKELLFLSKNNIFFLWEKPWERYVRKRFPILQEFHLKRIFPGTVIVDIKEKTPFLILKSNSANCVFEKEGGNFDTTENFDYMGKSDLTVLSKINQAPFDDCPEKLDLNVTVFMEEFSNKAESDLEIKLERFWETPNLASGDLRIKTVEGWTLILDKNLGVEKELEMLKTVMQNQMEPDERMNLEYIDLRIQNRVYYKLKVENEESESTEKINN